VEGGGRPEQVEAYFLEKFFFLNEGFGRPQLLPQAEPPPFFWLLAIARQTKIAAVRAMIARVIHDCQLEDMGMKV
jgi:hypothetical protein